jgi:hypothetical protein
VKPDLRLAERFVSDARNAGGRVRMGYPWWLRPFLLPGVLAITLGRRIYLAPRLVARGEAAVERILRHELVHVRQVAHLGFPRFLFLYVTEYFHHRRSGLAHHAAYRAVSFEAEAFAAEDEKLAAEGKSLV